MSAAKLRGFMEPADQVHGIDGPGDFSIAAAHGRAHLAEALAILAKLHTDLLHCEEASPSDEEIHATFGRGAEALSMAARYFDVLEDYREQGWDTAISAEEAQARAARECAS